MFRGGETGEANDRQETKRTGKIMTNKKGIRESLVVVVVVPADASASGRLWNCRSRPFIVVGNNRSHSLLFACCVMVNVGWWSLRCAWQDESNRLRRSILSPCRLWYRDSE